MTWDLKLFFDGDCPLCKREINWLKKRTGAKVCYVDIGGQEFAASEDVSLGYDRLMSEIHAMLPDGKLISGMDVFRHLYTLSGLSWLVAVTKLPIVRPLLDVAYKLFARYRLTLTGRRCADNSCKV